MPWDLDIVLEMNNGRGLTLYDLARFDQGFRSSVSRGLRSKGWGPAVGGAWIRRRRVRVSDLILQRARPLRRDDRWFYAPWVMTVRGRAVSAGPMRTCVTDATEIVPTDRAMAALGRPDRRPPLPDRAQALAEARRPWPPQV